MALRRGGINLPSTYSRSLSRLRETISAMMLKAISFRSFRSYVESGGHLNGGSDPELLWLPEWPLRSTPSPPAWTNEGVAVIVVYAVDVERTPTSSTLTIPYKWLPEDCPAADISVERHDVEEDRTVQQNWIAPEALIMWLFFRPPQLG